MPVTSGIEEDLDDQLCNGRVDCSLWLLDNQNRGMLRLIDGEKQA
jgi:hypothetical protein